MFEDPSSQMLRAGPTSLSDAQLLSFLFTRGGAPGEQALATAEALLCAAGGLRRLNRFEEAEFCLVPGIGKARAQRLTAIGELARRMGERRLTRGVPLNSAAQVYESLRATLGLASRECFHVLLLDSRCRLIRRAEIARGGLNSVTIHPRDVFEPALREGAASLILVHNHPSGDPTPSGQDLTLTDRLVSAADLLGIEIADHVIIGDGRYASLREDGLILIPTALRPARACSSEGRPEPLS